uniref:Protein tyrosine phosphatase non-receptor type 20 n=1 Tax=Amphilophus citrinellus TaxID=61819 RepID=A0A3Q0T6A6_AMPCI
SCVMQVEFSKPEGGGLGFALVGGTNGSMLRVREICSGGVAEQDGRLRVGDILLEVNGVIVSGLSHSKVVEIIRKAEGTVQLTICRDILPLKQIVSKLLDQSCKDIRKTQSDGWSSEDDDDGPPIVSEEELARLALIAPAKASQYSGSRVKALIQILQHQLDQQELVKEFMALEHLKPSDNCLAGKAPENRDKNRYRDILPDKTRVVVGENQDYINASYIRMQVGDEEFFYISCQGPLPSTVQTFWQMIWENKSD